jgi:hypothetical protein
MRYQSLCHVAEDPDAFEAAVEEALRTDSREARERRSSAMQNETWPQRVAAVGAIVEAAMEEKARRGSSPPIDAAVTAQGAAGKGDEC